MTKYVAFLRGVNLARRRRVGSSELRALFEEMGFGGVNTFRTSGNVIFGAERESLRRMAGRIETGLAEALGFDVVIFLRTESEIQAIANYQPFARNAAQEEASKGKLQVVFLSAKPATRARKDVLALATEADRLAFGDRELYWLPSGGTQESALDFKAVERLLGATTMRTKGTVEQLAAKYLAD